MDTVVFQFSTTASKPFFWTGWNNRASYIIRCMGHSPFSHMDLVLADGTLLGASDSPNAPVIRGNPGGVAIRPFDYQEFGLRRQMILRTDYADKITEFCLAQVGKPFDSSALWNFLSPSLPGVRDWRDPAIWYCSEMFVCAVENSGYFFHILGKNKLPWPKDRASPTDFLMIFMLDENWVNRDTFWQQIPGLKLDKWER